MSVESWRRRMEIMTQHHKDYISPSFNEIEMAIDVIEAAKEIAFVFPGLVPSNRSSTVTMCADWLRPSMLSRSHRDRCSKAGDMRQPGGLRRTNRLHDEASLSTPNRESPQGVLRTRSGSPLSRTTSS